MTIKRILKATALPLMNEGGWVQVALAAVAALAGPVASVVGAAANPVKWPPGVNFSEQEKSLLEKLQGVLDTQGKLQKDILPGILGMLGLSPTGKAIPFDEQVGKYLGQEERELLSTLRSKFKSALTGEGVFSPGLEQDISDYERIAGEDTRRQLGKNFLRSSAGPTAFSRMKTFGLRERDRSRREYIGLLSGAYSRNRRTSAGIMQNRAMGLRSFYQPYNLAQGYLSALGPYTGLREDKWKRELRKREISQENKARMISTIGSLFGSVGAMGSMLKK